MPPQTLLKSRSSKIFFGSIVIVGIVALSLVIIFSIKRTNEEFEGKNQFEENLKYKDNSKVATELKLFMNQSVDPCQDFYQYACGGFQAKRTKWLNSSNSTNDRTNMFRELLPSQIEEYEKLLGGIQQNSSLAERAVATFYESCKNKQITGIDVTPRNMGLSSLLTGLYPNISDFLEEYGEIHSSCEEMVEDFFPEVILYLIATKENTSQRSQILNLVQQLKDTLAKTFQEFEWMDSESWEIIENRLNNLQITLNYHPNHLNRSLIESPVYQKYVNNFKNNSFSYNKFTLLVYFKIYGVGELESLMTQNTPAISIMPGFNDSKINIDQIFIPQGFWKKPMFDFNYPDLINFARFGTILSHELVHAFQLYINIKVIQGMVFTNNYSPVTNHTKNAYNEKAECVAEQFEKIIITIQSGEEFNIDGYFTETENVADILGYQNAFKTFLKHGKYQTFPGMQEFSKEQVFFIAAAQSFCEAYIKPEIEENELVQQLEDSHSPLFIRVRGLANFDEFGKAFNCPLGSVYNPQDKCVF